MKPIPCRQPVFCSYRTLLSTTIQRVNSEVVTAMRTEGLPGVLGNKETWAFTVREQGNKRKIKLGTREQKHILGNKEHQNRRNTFREQGNMEPTPPPPPHKKKRPSEKN